MVSEAPLRVFLDTNVLFSALYSPSGPPARLIQAASSGHFQAVISDRVLDELVRNLRQKAPHILASIGGLFVNTSPEVVPHPSAAEVEPWLQAGLKEDSAIIAAAISAQCDYLCTGDRGVLDKASLCEKAGLKLIRPTDLARLVQ